MRLHSTAAQRLLRTLDRQIAEQNRAERDRIYRMSPDTTCTCALCATRWLLGVRWHWQQDRPGMCGVRKFDSPRELVQFLKKKFADEGTFDYCDIQKIWMEPTG